jgi:hypothetical protein
VIGKWADWYKDLKGIETYGNRETYRRAAKFFDGMQIEDWGCGKGGFRKYHTGPYIGLDGTANQFVDKVVDLTRHRSNSDGVLLRHVLEHNYAWQAVLTNAINSARKKFCLVLFTPFQDETKEIAHNRDHGVDVPDIGFRQQDIEEILGDFRMEEVGGEHIYYVEK